MPGSKSTLRLILEPIAVAVVLAAGVRLLVHLYDVPSESMTPTLAVGDHIVVTPYLAKHRPTRGDIVVFRAPQHRDELLVKRVIAEPGDLIETRLGRVVIGGHALAEPYVAAQSASGSIAPQIIPSDCYFVMGDNRANSIDSRNWGVVPRSLIVGRVRMVLWSSRGTSPLPLAHASPRLFHPVE